MVLIAMLAAVQRATLGLVLGGTCSTCFCKLSWHMGPIYAFACLVCLVELLIRHGHHPGRGDVMMMTMTSCYAIFG
jgi:hypothetical protein